MKHIVISLLVNCLSLCLTTVTIYSVLSTHKETTLDMTWYECVLYSIGAAFPLSILLSITIITLLFTKGLLQDHKKNRK